MVLAGAPIEDADKVFKHKYLRKTHDELKLCDQLVQDFELVGVTSQRRLSMKKMSIGFGIADFICVNTYDRFT